MSIRATTCPCCGGAILRHIRHGELYWFCPSCRQEMPLLIISQFANFDTSNTAVVPQSVLTS